MACLELRPFLIEMDRARTGGLTGPNRVELPGPSGLEQSTDEIAATILKDVSLARDDTCKEVIDSIQAESGGDQSDFNEKLAKWLKRRLGRDLERDSEEMSGEPQRFYLCITPRPLQKKLDEAVDENQTTNKTDEAVDEHQTKTRTDEAVDEHQTKTRTDEAVEMVKRLVPNIVVMKLSGKMSFGDTDEDDLRDLLADLKKN